MTDTERINRLVALLKKDRELNKMRITELEKKIIALEKAVASHNICIGSLQNQIIQMDEIIKARVL